MSEMDLFSFSLFFSFTADLCSEQSFFYFSSYKTYHIYVYIYVKKKNKKNPGVPFKRSTSLHPITFVTEPQRVWHSMKRRRGEKKQTKEEH